MHSESATTPKATMAHCCSFTATNGTVRHYCMTSIVIALHILRSCCSTSITSTHVAHHVQSQRTISAASHSVTLCYSTARLCMLVLAINNGRVMFMQDATQHAHAHSTCRLHWPRRGVCSLKPSLAHTALTHDTCSHEPHSNRSVLLIF